MSGQAEGEEAEEGSREAPIVNLFLQEAVYALMAEFDIQITNPNPPPSRPLPLPPPPPPFPQESQQKFATSASGLKIRFIGPAMPLKKRPFTGVVDDSKENEMKKREKKEDDNDQKARREPVEDSIENEEKMEEDNDQVPRKFEPADDENHQKKDQKPISEKPSEDSKEDEREKKEEDDQVTPTEESLENEEKMKEDDQVSRIEPAVQDSQEHERKKKEEDDQVPPAEESLENEEKMKEDDQISRTEPPVQDSPEEDDRLRKEEDVHEPRDDYAEETSKETEIGEEEEVAALMLLIFVAKFIDYWRRLNHYNEPKDDLPPLPLSAFDYSPSSMLRDLEYNPASPLHDFEYTPALPINRRLFNIPDEADDDYQEPTMAEGLGKHLYSVFFNRRAQLTFLRILSEYMDAKNEAPSWDITIPDEFIADWFPKNVIQADVNGAFEFLEMQHKEKVRQTKLERDYWDPYQQMAYEYGCKIWGKGGGGGDDDDDVIPAEDEHESQGVWNVSEVDVSEEDWTHLDTEIAILDRVIAYKVRNGRNPFPDDSDLADFIKNWLRINVPVKEFNELLTCLREKYEKRAGKRPANESSSNTKEDKVLDFALKIWG